MDDARKPGKKPPRRKAGADTLQSLTSSAPGVGGAKEPAARPAPSPRVPGSARDAKTPVAGPAPSPGVPATPGHAKTPAAESPQLVVREGTVELHDTSASGKFAGHSAPEPMLPLDVPAYLQHLLHEVEHIEITGISGRPGRSREALLFPIEEMYTPQTARMYAVRAPRVERARLSDLLPRYKRLLLVGQPGSGKTTFLRLVACMLARDLLGPPRETPWRTEHLGLPARQEPHIPGFVRMATLVTLFEKHSRPGRPDTRAWLLDLLAVQCGPGHSQIADALQDPGHEDRCRQWDERLCAGEVILLLDGLDEVADEALRQRVLRVFQDAHTTWPKSQIVITSRPIAHEHLRAIGFHDEPIEPFGPAEVARFVAQWSTALFQGKNARSSEHEQVLLAAIRTRPELRRLATNPVMLTCLCVIHWNEGRMPESRARVYRAIFTWMLATRREKRQRAGFTDGFAENALAALALAMMCHPEGKQANFDVGEAATAIDEEFLRHLPQFSAEIRARAATEQGRRRVEREWLLRECEWSHIVQEIAGNQLRFWHLTLQEFLAALALAWRDDGEGPEDWWPIVGERLDEPQWRETLELLPGCLYDEGGQRRVDRLVERALAQAQTGDLKSEARAVGHAGRLLAPMRAYDYSPRPQIAADYEAMRARVMAIFTLEGAAEVPLKVRIAAAEALGQAGDPRLAEDNFIPVPGTDVAMGRYPVTVGEFARFVDDDEGYASVRWWDAEGWKWRTQNKRDGPWGWDVQSAFPNRPVSGVSWWEARAYCAWLKRRLGPALGEVRLPRAEEWEQAATPSRGQYPRGEPKPNDTRANFRGAVGAPTPVGLYPAGIGPHKHLDLAGNVWEWCDDGPEHAPDGRWIKGGSWADGDAKVLAAAFRFRHWGVDDAFGFRVVVASA